jgi:hypothetical protein
MARIGRRTFLKLSGGAAAAATGTSGIAAILATRLALSKDAPVTRRIERHGAIQVVPFLGGLHHRYCRI